MVLATQASATTPTTTTLTQEQRANAHSTTDQNNLNPQPQRRIPLRQTLLDTASVYIAGVNNPGPDLGGAIALRTPDCTQQMLPASLGFLSRGLTNDEYVAYVQRVGQVAPLMNFTLRVADGRAPVVDEEEKVVVLPLASSGETPFGPYENEYVIMLGMTADGSRIRTVTEFVDSRVTGEFLGRIGLGYGLGGAEGGTAGGTAVAKA